MTKREVKRIAAITDKHSKRLAADRDKLDGDISELEQLREDCIDAWENLQSARDALSRWV